LRDRSRKVAVCIFQVTRVDPHAVDESVSYRKQPVGARVIAQIL